MTPPIPYHKILVVNHVLGKHSLTNTQHHHNYFARYHLLSVTSLIWKHCYHPLPTVITALSEINHKKWLWGAERPLLTVWAKGCCLASVSFHVWLSLSLVYIFEYLALASLHRGCKLWPRGGRRQCPSGDPRDGGGRPAYATYSSESQPPFVFVCMAGGDLSESEK